jgi:hypothetical protein
VILSFHEAAVVVDDGCRSNSLRPVIILLSLHMIPFVGSFVS